MDFSAMEWIWLGLTALSVGISKMGLGAVLMLMIPIIANVFGGIASVGFILPMLLAGDVLAVIHYKHHIQFHELRKLLVWVVIGIVIGLVVGQYINDALFKVIVAVSVMVCLLIMIIAEIMGKPIVVPKRLFFYTLVGILGGFTSMVGNAAGPIMSIYLLSRGYPKESFISTSAWLFLMINVIKLPLQIFGWHNIGVQNLYVLLILLPVILLGAVAGVYVVKRINEVLYRRVIYAMTLVAAVMLLV